MVEDAGILPFSVSWDMGMLSTDGSERRRSLRVLYHAYLVSENHNKADVITSAHESGIHIGSNEDTLSVKKVGRSGKVDVDKKGSEKESFEHHNEKSKEPSDFSLETERIPEEV